MLNHERLGGPDPPPPDPPVDPLPSYKSDFVDDPSPFSSQHDVVQPSLHLVVDPSAVECSSIFSLGKTFRGHLT